MNQPVPLSEKMPFLWGGAGKWGPSGAARADHSRGAALGGCWGLASLPHPHPFQPRAGGGAYTSGWDVGGEGGLWEDRRAGTTHSLFREALQVRPVHPKGGNCFVYMPVLIKILMAWDIDFEPKMGFRFWFGYTNSGNSNILNNFISFFGALFIYPPSVSQALSHSEPIKLCSPSSSSCPDMKLPSLSSHSYRLGFLQTASSLFKITA